MSVTNHRLNRRICHAIFADGRVLQSRYAGVFRYAFRTRFGDRVREGFSKSHRIAQQEMLRAERRWRPNKPAFRQIVLARAGRAQ